jgi:hypothetical protein
MGQSTKASTIANDLLIVGNISSSGAIRLEGRVRGDVQCASLVLGENSQLEGCAIAPELGDRGRALISTASHVLWKIRWQLGPDFERAADKFPQWPSCGPMSFSRVTE